MASSKTKKTVKVIKTLRSENTPKIIENSASSSNKSYSFISKLVIVALLGTVSYLLAFKYRNLLLVGIINNTPITRFELNAKMAERYGKQTFEEMVNENLLNAQIKKNNIVVTDQELKAEIDKMIAQYGSEDTFKSTLEQYGLTLEKAKKTISQSMAFKKLVESSNKIEITDASIKKYFEDNKANFTGKKLEDVSASIKDTLYQQEIYTKSQEMFSNIRKEAKVTSYL